MPDDLTAQLVDLEHARCLAITNADIPALELLNSGDLTYTHTGGQTEDLQVLPQQHRQVPTRDHAQRRPAHPHIWRRRGDDRNAARNVPGA